jgi:hypothetical protein
LTPKGPRPGPTRAELSSARWISGTSQDSASSARGLAFDRRFPAGSLLPRVVAALTAVCAALALTGCTSGSGSPPATSTPTAAPFLRGDPARLPLTGPSDRPVKWTLLAAPSADQREIQTSLQQFESLMSDVALHGPIPAYTAMWWSLTGAQVALTEPPAGTSAETVGGGVVWEKVYRVTQGRVDLATTVVCRDQRSGASTASGTPVTARTPQVSLLAYQWELATTLTPTYGSTRRWRFDSPAVDTGDIRLATCTAWARTHRTWTGPSAG